MHPGAAATPGALEGSPQVEVYTINTADPQSTLKVMQTLLAGLPDVRMDIDPKTNNLIVLARPAQHATIRATLDQMQHDARQVEVIRLRMVDPQMAVLSINKLFGGGDASKGGTGTASRCRSDYPATDDPRHGIANRANQLDVAKNGRDRIPIHWQRPVRGKCGCCRCRSVR